ncbi:MAG TPA: polysaccharide deacetylase family protein [Nitrososphaeraceae archaeon]|nr:polysaccharide deacetylase family protein [Nitrososphaeraceae archaeon]
MVISLTSVLWPHNDKSLPTSLAAQNGSYFQCKCVIFRLDDIEDYGKNRVQLAILDHFIAENKKLVPAIILDRFGNLAPDGAVYLKVKEGYNKGLFEPAIHGVKHIKYSGLTKEQQKEDFTKANNKLQLLLGGQSRIFVPPFNQFDSNTLKALAESGLDIISTSYREENKTLNPYKISAPFTTNYSNIDLSVVNVSEPGRRQTSQVIYHIPFNISLLDLTRRGYSGENLTDKVLSSTESNIAEYGFSIIVLHPNDFATFNSSTGSYGNSIDTVKMQTLTKIINELEAKRINFADYSNMTQ